ncbi:hypothetical protein ACFL5O_05175 [Myxococcota bacterium]
MRAHRACSALLWAALSLASLGPQAGCRRPTDVVAQLADRRGTVQRDTGQQFRNWRDAVVGDEFRLGDAVRSREASEATLRLRGKAKLTLSPNSTVRFLTRSSTGRTALDIEVGVAELEIESEPLQLDFQVGPAVVEAGSRVRFSRTRRGMRFDVTVGKLRLEVPRRQPGDSVAGQRVEVAAGQRVEVAPEGVVLQRARLGSEMAATSARAPNLAASGSSIAVASDSPQLPGVGSSQALAAGQASSAVAQQIRSAGAGSTQMTGPEPTQTTTVTNEPRIQTLVAGQAVSQRASDGTWHPLPPGNHWLMAGTRLRIDASTNVRLARGGDRAILGQGRFVVGAAGGSLAEALGGPVRLPLSSRAEVRVPGGSVVAREARTSAVVEVDAERRITTVRVHVGTVEVKGRRPARLHGGEVGILTPDGSVTVMGRSAAVADLTAPAGESFTVHDSRLPTRVGLRTRSTCPDGAVVRLAKGGWTSGHEVTTLSLPPGVHRYSVHCLSPRGVAAHAALSGTVTVVRDSEKPPVARTPPTTVVDTDGRRYTVLYQSRLPVISITWSTAPRASQYVLHVDSKTYGCAEPRYTFEEGSLAAGKHQVWFEALGPRTRRSQRTPLLVKLASATPTASVRVSSDGRVATGTEVVVSGRALPGWQVRVGDQPVETDAQSRFETRVVVPPGPASLPIRFDAEGQDSHYYVRRAR